MTDADQPRTAGATGSEEDDAAGTVGRSIAAAARRSALAGFADGSASTSAAMMTALGGVRGLIETVLPGLVFLVVYTLSTDVPISLAASVGVAVVFTIARLVSRSNVTQALAGLLGVAVSAVLALITGKGQDNFVPGMVINSVSALVLTASMVVRWPLIGVVAGFLMDDGVAWRSRRPTRRAMQAVTLLWIAMFALRLVVETPLYFAGDVEGLAIARLITGIPLYAPLLLVTWFIVRAVFRRREPDTSMVELSRRQDK